MLPTRKVSGDRLAMVSRNDAADVAHLALSPIQEHRPEELVAGVAVLFYVMARYSGLDPEELYHRGRRILTDSEGDIKTNNALQSLRDFASFFVAGRETTIS